MVPKVGIQSRQLNASVRKCVVMGFLLMADWPLQVWPEGQGGRDGECVGEEGGPGEAWGVLHHPLPSRASGAEDGQDAPQARQH